MKNKYIILILASLLLCGCSKFLEPLRNGAYTEENYADYPNMIRGFVEKAYSIRPNSYISPRYLATDGMTDDMTWKDPNASTIQLANNNGKMTDYFLSQVYTDGYKAIYYCNLFLDDNIGLNTRYMVNESANERLQRSLHGDAYAVRAWFLFDLLKHFGGRSASGELLGVPIFTEPVAPHEADMSTVKRATYEECINQIIADCDSAYAYLPLANRDFLKEAEEITVLGAIRYRKMDGISVKALKALALLQWASPAFNPNNDKARWDAAARAAKEVIDHKLNIEGSTVVSGGFNPKDYFMWNNPNATGAIYISQIQTDNESYETNFYPIGYGGVANYVPTQELVDAFPMANGYPITDSRSGYDSQNPYANRDPRFYANIFYNGCQVVRNTNASDIMYTFDMTEGVGQDAPNLVNTSRTGYYIRKYVYLGWNPNDASPQTAQHCIFFYRWAHMCLAFAEAANNAVGPLDNTTYGLSAKDAIAYLRNRPQETVQYAIGDNGDPYLDECASAGAGKFAELIKNEWRLETCFEGFRFNNVRRWATSADELDATIHRIKVTYQGGTPVYEKVELEKRDYSSQWMPIPYLEIRKGASMEQNEGWESWR